MSDTPPEHSRDPGWCQIRLKGHLGPRWAARFDGMILTTRADGTTLIEGPVVDQAALHGLLRACATSASRCSRSPTTSR
jgi:hypothetical protein